MKVKDPYVLAKLLKEKFGDKVELSINFPRQAFKVYKDSTIVGNFYEGAYKEDGLPFEISIHPQVIAKPLKLKFYDTGAINQIDDPMKEFVDFFNDKMLPSQFNLVINNNEKDTTIQWEKPLIPTR
ncbi:MAG: hypothetical protein PHX09_03890 [Clostridia bacterium]|nr:hypothetical protein [Clostridia bacterium]MDD4686392.1 hypothetical protein [Clostridia bacterium]